MTPKCIEGCSPNGIWHDPQCPVAHPEAAALAENERLKRELTSIRNWILRMPKSAGQKP